jgi:hypothetical protein
LVIGYRYGLTAIGSNHGVEVTGIIASAPVTYRGAEHTADDEDPDCGFDELEEDVWVWDGWDEEVEEDEACWVAIGTEEEKMLGIMEAAVGLRSFGSGVVVV